MQFVPGYQNLDSNMFGDISPPPARHSNLPSSSWLHVPPMHMPWGTPLADQPNIVRFTADSTFSAASEPIAGPSATPSTSYAAALGSVQLGAFPSDQFNMSNLQCKRRIESEDEIRSPKKHITEEKMAAHMSMLSISGDHPRHEQPMATEQLTEEKPTSSSDEGGSTGKRVILSKELRAMQKEPILPPSLITKLDKKSMALVLWQPPAGILADHLRTSARLNSASGTDERRNQQQVQQQQLDSADNNNTPAAVDLNAFTTQQGVTLRDVEMEM